jgi:hypothetical protein
MVNIDILEDFLKKVNFDLDAYVYSPKRCFQNEKSFLILMLTFNIVYKY